MRYTDVTRGSVVTLGHPNNERLAVCTGPGEFRLLHTGEPVNPEEFRADWETYVPKDVHPEMLADYLDAFTAQEEAAHGR